MKYHTTHQSISWFRDRCDEGTLSIQPPYQRRPVWTTRQKSHLIETILLKFPIPEIYIHVTIDDDGKSQYAVVDGQQRIRAILQFVGADRDESESDYNNFALEYVDPQSDYFDWTFNNLDADKKREFFAYQLSVREIHDATGDQIRDIFTRLNKYLTKLSPQELRNATYSGPFVRLADALTNNEYWSENGIVSPAIIRRMGDIEFVSELLIGLLDGPQGGKADIIDEYYRRFEESDDEFPGQLELKRRFARTLHLIETVYPSIAETRWKNRTDFYSLFVAFGHMLRTRTIRDTESVRGRLKRALDEFATNVERAIQVPHSKVATNAAQYAQAHVKGSNDKLRRAARHGALLQVVDGFFEEKKVLRSARKAVER